MENLKDTYQVSHARYAKGKMAVHCKPDGSGWKTMAALVISRLSGVRYSNREKAYICSARQVAKFESEMAEVQARWDRVEVEGERAEGAEAEAEAEAED